MESPLQKLQSPFLKKHNITLYVKRDDIIHPEFGGNKWRKLKYNLLHAKENQYHTLLTFGGAWSNHIYATAAAGKYFGFKTIGFIRGEEHKPLNTTLSFAKSCGMQLHYLDRKTYRKKNEAVFLKDIQNKHKDAYLIPEGGSNAIAVKGCQEIVDEINITLDNTQQASFNTICCASGTGATLAGISTALQPEQNAIGFSALKGGDFLVKDINHFLKDIKQTEVNTENNWRVETQFHFGGYAKVNNELLRFMKDFEDFYGFTLDAVYTAKMFYGLFELIKNKHFKSGSTIVAVHSGGLQGNQGFKL